MRDFSGWKAFAGAGNLMYTVGNLGMSQTRCMSFKMITDKVSLGCETGLISDVEEGFPPNFTGKTSNEFIINDDVIIILNG
jgi:hypothetical protein